MARTAVAAGIVALAYDAGVASATQAADATNGNILSFSLSNTPPTYGPFNIILAVTNADSASHTVILRAAGYTGAASGAANSANVKPAEIVFDQASLGDLSVVVANGTTQYIGPLSTGRFTQQNNVNGGDLWIDWSAATSMTFSAILLPTLSV
jgi:hypothetical protein